MGVLGAQASQQTACESLFDGLHDQRWIAAPGFADEQMDVFGHDHISGDGEVVAAPHLFQNAEKQIPMARAVQQRQTLVAAGGDEVGVSGSVVAMEAARHGRGVAQRMGIWL